MTWPFVLGRTYSRRRDIHDRYAGQQQGGIITPAQHPVVIVITGKVSKRTGGYVDTQHPDGTFDYMGEGQRGDMVMNRGNAAIQTHWAQGKSLLMFAKTQDGLRFNGEWVCTGWSDVRVPDFDGLMRNAFAFHLIPIDQVQAAEDLDDQDPTPPTSRDLGELRLRALEAAAPAQGPQQTSRRFFERSREVRRYVLARGGANCEGCGEPAPFVRLDGTPYLEPHHTIRVSDGGPDHPDHVIAVCPNCHRRVHAGRDGGEYNEALKAKLITISAATLTPVDVTKRATERPA